MVVSTPATNVHEITITGFHAYEIDFVRLENHVHRHLLQRIEEVLRGDHVNRVKVAIQWHMEDKDGKPFEHHMNLNVMEIIPHARGASAEAHVLELLDRIVEKACEAMRNQKMQESGITYVGVKYATITTVRGNRDRLLAPPQAPQEHVGRGSFFLPPELRNRGCCLVIDNMDELCFRYVMTAWRRPCAESKHAGRANKYITNAPAGGRRPRDFVPEFVDCGLDFSMLTYPVAINALEAFEDKNDVSIYVFEWRGNMAVIVRRPQIARKRENEVCLLLHKEHWVLVKSPQAFLHGPGQKDQLFCYRCQKVFWHNKSKLDNLTTSNHTAFRMTTASFSSSSTLRTRCITRSWCTQTSRRTRRPWRTTVRCSRR